MIESEERQETECEIDLLERVLFTSLLGKFRSTKDRRETQPARG